MWIHSASRDITSLEKIISQTQVKALCIENTHNFSGGICLNKEEMQTIGSIAKNNKIPLHVDGARICNAATYLKTSVSELVEPVDSVMFCLSKGLGAPIGSILCGSAEFILEARKVRKLIGGVMRQARGNSRRRNCRDKRWIWALG